jgi:PIN domain nuclease of toxin-antitoxin system
VGSAELIVLDTHAWVWWLSEPGRLPAPAREAIDRSLDEATPVLVSSISAWEVAMLVERNRLELTIPLLEWLTTAEAAPEIDFIPVGNRIAVRSVRLPDFGHKDPADRIIVATALETGAALVTSDARLRAYTPLDTVWDGSGA